MAYLQENKVSIWDEWATAEQCARFGRTAGDLGPVYGHVWRNYGASENPDGSYAEDGIDWLELKPLDADSGFAAVRVGFVEGELAGGGHGGAPPGGLGQSSSAMP